MRRAPAQPRAIDRVEMARDQPVERTHRIERVAQQHGIGVPAAEHALPAFVRVVRLGQPRIEQAVVRGQRPRAVAREIAAQHAQVPHGRADAHVAQHRLHRRGRDRAPCRVRMKAAPFVEQHALRAFEHHGARPAGVGRRSPMRSALAGGACSRHGATASSQRCASESSWSTASSCAALPRGKAESANSCSSAVRKACSFSNARAGYVRSP
jgi:hypothetical protein